MILFVVNNLTEECVLFLSLPLPELLTNIDPYYFMKLGLLELMEIFAYRERPNLFIFLYELDCSGLSVKNFYVVSLLTVARILFMLAPFIITYLDFCS